jgi:hypothetical protein
VAADPFATQDQDQTAADQAAAANQDTALENADNLQSAQADCQNGIGQAQAQAGYQIALAQANAAYQVALAGGTSGAAAALTAAEGQASVVLVTGQADADLAYTQTMAAADCTLTVGEAGVAQGLQDQLAALDAQDADAVATEQTAQTLGDAAAQDQLASAQQAALDGYNNGVAQAYVAYLSFRRFQAGQVARCR